MLHAGRMRKHVDALAGMHLARLFLGEMKCSIAVSCFLFKVAEKVVLYLFFIQNIPASQIPLQLENRLHFVLCICCIPVTTEMETLRFSTNHSLSKQKWPRSLYWKIVFLKRHWTSLRVSGPVAAKSWYHLKSDHLPLSLVPGKFLSANSSGAAILTSPFWRYYLSFDMIH